MRELIGKYVGEQIGLNVERPLEYNLVQLVGVTDEYFTVLTPGGRQSHYAYRIITNVVEGGGLQLKPGSFSKAVEVRLLVEVYRFNMVKGGGSIGFGIAF